MSIIQYDTGGLEVVGDYLLDEGQISQDEREIIVESLFEFTYNK